MKNNRLCAVLVSVAVVVGCAAESEGIDGRSADDASPKDADRKSETSSGGASNGADVFVATDTGGASVKSDVVVPKEPDGPEEVVDASSSGSDVVIPQDPDGEVATTGDASVGTDVAAPEEPDAAAPEEPDAAPIGTDGAASLDAGFSSDALAPNDADGAEPAPDVALSGDTGANSDVVTSDATVSVEAEAMPDDANDGGTTVDASSNDGSADGAICQQRFAVNFNGGNARLARPIQDDFTIEAWIKTTKVSRTGTHFWAGDGIFWGDVAGSANDFGTSILNNKFAFGIGGGGGGKADFTLVSTATVVTGAWTHVAASRQRSSGTMRVYVNGAPDGMRTTTNIASLTAAANMYFGANPVDMPNRVFVGSIDEVRLWNVVRTDAEILADMNRTFSAADPGLVGYYRFATSGGTVVTDSSMLANNATLTGVATWETSTRICGGDAAP